MSERDSSPDAQLRAVLAEQLLLVTRLEAEIAHLRTALETRVVIEQAKGAVSARYGLPPERAFERIRSIARGKQRRLHDFCAEVVASGGRLPRPEQ